ncbi:DNA polymerase III subunit gamma/tau [Candidatus Saccharibacteria bacterium]|nr:DNA polymerase III subunit gamma/tau [Candidatus Saccharibacteria bacterium]
MLALYRKYRPKTLAEVVGQPQITTPLENALKSGKISHSYLFTGPRGCGKTSVARILAHEINNFPYELEDSYLDIVEIDAASNTGVDNIRELREKATILPSKGKYKVYIIDEVHMLSKSAFNALLKTLEEPPAHVIFILATTDLEKVPVTITSRSQVFHFYLVGEEILLPYLKEISKKENIKISDSALKVIISRGGGSFRDSLSLLDQVSSLGDGKTEISEAEIASALGLPLASELSALLEAYKSGDLNGVSEKLKSLLSEGLKPETLAEEIIKKILKSPEPELLPLLEKLPSVSAPFPEAKLLLSLTNFSKLKIPAPLPDNRTPEKPAPTPVRQKVQARMKTPQISAEKPTDFNESAFFDAVKLANPAVFQQLQKCDLRFENGVLNLYPDKKIIKSILSRPNNFEILSANVSENVKITLHDPEEKLKISESDSALSKISDIMGKGIKEVDSGGGIPF